MFFLGQHLLLILVANWQYNKCFLAIRLRRTYLGQMVEHPGSHVPGVEIHQPRVSEEVFMHRTCGFMPFQMLLGVIGIFHPDITGLFVFIYLDLSISLLLFILFCVIDLTLIKYCSGVKWTCRFKHYINILLCLMLIHIIIVLLSRWNVVVSSSRGEMFAIKILVYG